MGTEGCWQGNFPQSSGSRGVAGRAPGAHCRHSGGSRSHLHSREAGGAAAASEEALWKWEAGVGPEPPCLAPLPPPAVPILPILSSGASSPGPDGSAFSSGGFGQGRSGLLLLGGGRGCF